jgi:hypothetical protein
MVTHGILAHQYTPAERELDLASRFKGQVTLAGKDKGVDCAVSTQDLTRKVCSPCLAKHSWLTYYQAPVQAQALSLVAESWQL